MNAIFQEYKRQVDECKVIFVDDLEIPYTVKATDFYVDERGKYCRAKKKQEDKEMIKEWEDNER